MRHWRLPATTRPYLTCFIVVLAGAGACQAARKPDIKFLRETELPHIGLKMKLMHPHTERPLPPPYEHLYTATQGEKTLKQTRYDPRDLWRATQFSGQWEDEHGNRLTLGRVLYPLPAHWPHEHVLRETYDEAMKSVINTPPTSITEEALNTWVRDFAGADKVTAKPVQRRPFSLGEVIEFDIEADTPSWMVGHCFRFRTDESGQRYFALFQLNRAIAPERALKAIREVFLPSLKQPRFTRATRTDRTKEFQDAKLLKRVDRTEEFMQSLEMARKSIASTRGWWMVETPNYVLASNLGAGKGTFVKQIQSEIELLRAAYETLLPPREPISAISVVRVFASAQEYKSYVGAQYQWTCGLWESARRELVIQPLDGESRRETRVQTLQTVYHEAFHQYIHYAFDETALSAWFDEGHATFFEGAQIRQGRIYVKEEPARLKQLASIVKAGDLNIPTLLKFSYTQFYTGDKQTLLRNYATVWGLIYFLRKSASLDNTSEYGRILQRYVDAVWTSKDAGKATEVAFEGIDMDAFQKDFVAFWHDRRARTAAERNDLFAGAKQP